MYNNVYIYIYYIRLKRKKKDGRFERRGQVSYIEVKPQKSLSLFRRKLKRFVPSLFLLLIEIYITFVRKEKRKMAGLKGGDKLFTSRSNERYLSPFRRKLKRSVPSLFLPYNRYITMYIIYLFEKKKKERWPVRKEGQVIYIEVKPRKSFFLEGSEEIYSFPISSPNRYITMYIIYLFEKKKERWPIRKKSSRQVIYIEIKPRKSFFLL